MSYQCTSSDNISKEWQEVEDLVEWWVMWRLQAMIKKKGKKTKTSVAVCIFHVIKSYFVQRWRGYVLIPYWQMVAYLHPATWQQSKESDH